MAPSISVVVHTLNEERNLPFALRSVRPWVDEIVVVDMASDDDTRAVAQRFGARIFAHERVGFVEPAREAGCAHATGDWILCLDADELVPEPLSRRLREIAAADSAEVVRLPRLNYILGGPLAHTGWNPARDLQTRFFKRGAVRMSAFVHENASALQGARVMDLPATPGGELVHFNYLDSTHFLYKLDRYAAIEAGEAHRRGERPSWRRLLLRGSREGLARYFRHGGWRDGWRGLSLSLLMVAYRVVVYTKHHELDDGLERSDVERRYRVEAERLLAAYAPPDAQRARTSVGAADTRP
jgi:glycosyltransferase involved in cell wall biosynthesis